MPYEIGDIVDLRPRSGGTRPEGQYEVVHIEGSRITIQHRETQERQTVHEANLVGFRREGPIDWP